MFIRSILVSVFVTILSLAPGGSRADELLEVFSSAFDPNNFTRDELRLLQLGLISETDHRLNMSGIRDRKSDAALHHFSQKRFEDFPKNGHLMAIYLEADLFISNYQSQEVWYATSNLSLLMPSDFREKMTFDGTYANLGHKRSSLKYSFSRTDFAKMVDFHNFADLEAAKGRLAKRTRDTDLWHTTLTKRDGTLLSIRSHYHQGAWASVFISAQPRHQDIFDIVLGSITENRRFITAPPKDRYLSYIINVGRQLVLNENAPTQSLNQTPNTPTSTGTGYAVTKQGHFVTNHHVIDDCNTVKINDQIVTVIASSEMFDLALIKSDIPTNQAVAKFAFQPVLLNQDIVAAGFPFSSVLSDLNITRGNVSSIQGIRGNEFNFQISAPVQPGNSGGPVLDNFGAVVGTVVSRLNEDAVGERLENVNFAIRNEITQLFLTQNNIQLTPTTNETELSPTDLGKVARDITYRIECY